MVRHSSLLVGLLSAMLVVACGDDDDSAGAPPSAGGSSGRSGNAGQGGVGGASGQGGAAGSSAGTAGTSAGAAGTSAGAAGTSSGAAGTSAGNAGTSSGAAGAAGSAGQAGGGGTSAGGAGAAGAASGASGAAGDGGSAGAGSITSCTPSPCANGGQCVEHDGGPVSCVCAAGFSGDFCETNPDDCPQPAEDFCLNGGTCVDGLDGYTCACAPGYTGDSCATNIDDCSPSPCQNGGTCTDGVNGYTCACATGFTGPSCETNIDECAAPGLCQNGGTCVDGVGSHTCECAAGFGGDDCSVSCGELLTAAKSGNWDDPATWAGGVVPPGNRFVLIPKDVVVVIPAGVKARQYACAGLTINGELRNEGSLTVDSKVTVQGPNPVVAARFTNAGSFELRGEMVSSKGASGASTVENQAVGTFVTSGTVTLSSFANAGVSQIKAGGMSCAVFSNGGTVTIEQGAVLNATTPAAKPAINAGTIVNHGRLEANHSFSSSGTITSTGTIEAAFDLDVPCSFRITETGTLNNSGQVSMYCPMNADGKVINSGTVLVQGVSWASLTIGGSFTNEASGQLINGNDLTNHGTITNHGKFRNASTSDQQQGFINSGTFTSTGAIDSLYVFRNQPGAHLVLDAGSTSELGSLLANNGLLDLTGTVILKLPGGKLMNSGVLNTYCGFAVKGQGIAAEISGNPPVDKCGQ